MLASCYRCAARMPDWRELHRVNFAALETERLFYLEPVRVGEWAVLPIVRPFA